MTPARLAVATSEPPPPRSIMWRPRAQREEGAIQVDVHHATPLRRRHLREVPRAAAAAHPRIGEAGVDAAEGLDRLGKAAVDRRLVRDVAAKRHGLGAVAFQLDEGRGVLVLVGAPDANG